MGVTMEILPCVRVSEPDYFLKKKFTFDEIEREGRLLEMNKAQIMVTRPIRYEFFLH
jgi:hypothetical protein